ncbi:hypothetical protein P4O66_007330 [Electrophorus voltai]|uniref:Uncharacterized protein n=1 Tax=Electrophorus voltai TaxID=2609070 RepID=A0AAD9E1J2_9TELE|nr:hypothetical protein P4O66_007330 [Electrophorus voltai]
MLRAEPKALWEMESNRRVRERLPGAACLGSGLAETLPPARGRRRACKYREWNDSAFSPHDNRWAAPTFSAPPRGPKRTRNTTELLFSGPEARASGSSDRFAFPEPPPAEHGWGRSGGGEGSVPSPFQPACAPRHMIQASRAVPEEAVATPRQPHGSHKQARVCRRKHDGTPLTGKCRESMRRDYRGNCRYTGRISLLKMETRQTCTPNLEAFTRGLIKTPCHGGINSAFEASVSGRVWEKPQNAVALSERSVLRLAHQAEQERVSVSLAGQAHQPLKTTYTPSHDRTGHDTGRAARYHLDSCEDLEKKPPGLTRSGGGRGLGGVGERGVGVRGKRAFDKYARAFVLWSPDTWRGSLSLGSSGQTMATAGVMNTDQTCIHGHHRSLPQPGSNNVVPVVKQHVDVDVAMPPVAPPTSTQIVHNSWSKVYLSVCVILGDEHKGVCRCVCRCMVQSTPHCCRQDSSAFQLPARPGLHEHGNLPNAAPGAGKRDSWDGSDGQARLHAPSQNIFTLLKVLGLKNEATPSSQREQSVRFWDGPVLLLLGPHFWAICLSGSGSLLNGFDSDCYLQRKSVRREG